MAIKTSHKSKSKYVAAKLTEQETYKPLSDTSLLGDSVSTDAMKQFKAYAKQSKINDTVKYLTKAFAAFQAKNWQKGAEWAIEALKIDEKCGEAWHFLAVAREKSGDLVTAFTCFETALKLLPNNLNIANDIGRLAYRLSHFDIAARFFRFVLNQNPYHLEAINNLCSALRETEELDEAIETLKQAISFFPAEAQLWNNIGTIMVVKGDLNTASIFFEEALRLDPNHVHALHNLGNIKTANGQIEEGRDLLLKALPLFDDMANVASAKLSIAYSYLALGELKTGWDWYHARHKEKTFEEMQYLIECPRWNPKEDLPNESMFISAEQGLGDEIMLASVLPDILKTKPHDFRWAFAVESRLVKLFQRSFPNTRVVKHHTTIHNGISVRLYPDIKDWSEYQSWALMADFLGSQRHDISQFPKHNAFLKPDPSRIEYWRLLLSNLNAKPKVGILWKSLMMHMRRTRFFSPFETWKPILDLKNVQFVTLQYGDIDEELREAEALGYDIWTPPEIDLKNDLDDLAALCVALDLVIGPSNATTNIAAASGANVWFINEPYAWTQLSTNRMPWYPDSEVFTPPNAGEWAYVMEEIKGRLTDL